MTSRPTRNPDLEGGGSQWQTSPTRALAVRGFVFLAPLMTAWLVVRLTSSLYWQPPGTVGVGVWIGQAFVVGTGVSLLLERLTRQLLPLAVLFEMSLVFPDQAPSRFAVALRARSAKSGRGFEAGASDQELSEQALEMLAGLNKHDRLTRGHSERVRAYADLIAEEMGLTPEDRAKLSWGALLHDLGKLEVPAEILNKTGRPDEQEWETLSAHPAHSIDMLASLESWLGEWTGAASQHHERWDGGGYPAGLVGTEISLAGRITAVADAYDTMTSKRSYKQPVPHAAARRELVACAGTQFDPEVVRAFLSTSLGRRRSLGPLAWLVELPGVWAVSSLRTAGAAVATAGVITGSISMGTITGPDAQPERVPAGLAFDQPTTTTWRATTTSVPGQVVDGAPSLGAAESTTTSTSLTTELTSSQPSSAPTTTTSPATTTTSADTTLDAGGTTTSVLTTTTTATTTTTTTTTSTSNPPPTGFTAYLENPGTGNTSSSPLLPLSLTTPTSSALANYDTDRDSEVGLGLKKDGDGLSTGDDTKYQDWEFTLSEPLLLHGSGTLIIWVAEKDLSANETVGVRAGLHSCNNMGQCQPLAAADWSGQSTSGFREATLTFDPLNELLPTGTRLVLRLVAFDQLTDVDIAIAYDTAGQPARLSFD